MMTATTSIMKVLIMISVIQLLTTMFFVCFITEARVLTPYEQAVGQWNVALKPSGWKKSQVPSLLFPPLRESVLSNNAASVTTNKHSNNGMNCQLSIFGNGTFVMKRDTPSNSTDTLPIRGKWKVQPNPYCITDRQYDQLILESYPRVQKRASDNETLQKVDLRLQCRVWGRYGSGPIRRFMGFNNQGRSMSRMTHGTLLWNVKQSQEPKLPPWKSRRICASFTAKPIDSSTITGDYEEDFDDDANYDEDDYDDL